MYCNILYHNTLALQAVRALATMAHFFKQMYSDDIFNLEEQFTPKELTAAITVELIASKIKNKHCHWGIMYADKTRNMYEMCALAYNKLVTENVTKTYKLADANTAKSINTELKDIASHLNIANRIEPMTETPAFISLKDHKENFNNNPQCRLINPAKSNLGKVSKTILDRINNNIRIQTRSNQWRNTDDTIEWFKANLLHRRFPG